MSWSAVATIVLLAVGLHFHQRTKFLFLPGLISEIWESENSQSGGCLCPRRCQAEKNNTCSVSICNCQPAHQQCVSSKTLLFLMQNLGIWRIMGTWGQNMSSKVPYLESPTLICLFTMQLLWGYNDD